MAVVGAERRRSFVAGLSAPYCALNFSGKRDHMGKRWMQAFGLMAGLMAGSTAVLAARRHR
jgi:hypothetical protein